jgi:translocation and assembly module TamB
MMTTRVVASNWDLEFLKTVFPERSVGGLLSAKIDVIGLLEKPSIVGTATLKNGSIHPGAPLYTLRNLDVDLVLTPAKLKITGKGVSGRGELSFKGLAAMADLKPQSMRLDLKLRRLPVEAGPLSISVDSKTVVRGTPNGTDWRIDVDVGDTVIVVPGETSRSLHPDVLPADIVFVDSLSTPPTTLAAALGSTPASVIDVYIRAPETISVRGEPVRTMVDVDLHARLANNLVLEGTVETRGGWIELFGRRYELRRGNLGFGGSTDPGLDIALTHDFSAMTLTIAVTGTGSDPQLALRADPARYDDSELLSFVLGASPDDDRSQEQTAAGRATGAASSFLASKMQAVVRNVIPIDVLKVDVADDQAAAEKLTVGKWLTERIFLAYRRRFEAQELENSNEAVIEYRFRRLWLLELTYGDEGTGGADVLWLKRF